MNDEVMDEGNGLLSFDPAMHQPGLLNAWKKFIETGFVDREVVPLEIANSWLRSREYNVDPHDFSPDSYLPEDEYKPRIVSNSRLIDLARPIMENVYSSLERTRYVVVLFDSDGYHLLRIGQRADLQRSSNFKIREGLCFEEKHVGTCGFSLVKKLKRPVQITGCEHYSALLHYVTGAYAPIFESRTERLVGIIGVSGARTLPDPHTLGIAIASATAIENLLALDKAREEVSIYSRSLQVAIDSIGDGVILVDKNGRIYEVNPAAQVALKLEKNDVEGRHVSEFRRIFPLERAVLNALRSRDREGKDIQCQIHNQIYLASIKFVMKTPHDVQGVMVQLKNVRNLSRIVQTLTSEQPQYTIESMVGKSDKMLEVKSMAQIAARSDAHVIIEGESGTGKEILAHAIHNSSSRKGQPFVVVNCAAIPPDLLESTLFGHEKGAFTGAIGTHIGKFELAEGGTLFLDEIADMSLGMQAKILRVIEERKVERVGGRKPFPINVRILAATNKDLYALVKDHLFREDLFYRLNVFRIVLPPLRERKGDLVELVYSLVAEFTPFYQKHLSKVSEGFVALLLRYNWPGNVRELRNAVQYSIARMDSDTLLPQHLKGFFRQQYEEIPAPSTAEQIENLDIVEERTIWKALESNRGNKARTAKALGIARATLYRKLRQMSRANVRVSF
jgi:sigma-54 dependent transcriptional regulator, acetoin dehydrogenase operon transcriptional activator AcoR